MGVVDWIKQQLHRPFDRRREPRRLNPPILTYYWDGSSPVAHRLRDLSPLGAYVYTTERWYLGTVIVLSMQPELQVAAELLGHVSLKCKVVRHGPDGVGMEFIQFDRREQERLRAFLRDADQNALRGQSLVEFALVLPLLFLLIVNAVNFGGFLFAWITVANAARTGAEYGMLGGATVGSPTSPTAAQITTVVTSDISSLVNRASLQVRVCTNNNGTITCTGTGSGATPADPEPATYVLTAVDVTYTYQPFIPLWDFSALGIHATLPATTIHRKAVMRVFQ